MLPINYFQAFFYLLIGIFLIFIIILFLFLYEWRSFSHRRKCRQLPGPKLKPIVGFGLDMARLEQSEVFGFVGNLIKKHGPILYMEMFGLPHVVLTDPVDVEKIFSNTQHTTKGFEYKFPAFYLREGLLISSGEKWQYRRKMLIPTLHSKILEDYVSIFNRNALLLTENLLQSSGEPCGDVDLYVSLCALDIICETVMGTELQSQTGNSREYVAAIRRSGEIILQRTLTFWYYRDWVFFNSPVGREFTKIVKHLHAFTDKVIKERKEMLNSSHYIATEPGKSKNRKSFLDLLIEMQKENPDIMTDADIREEVDTFITAGHDSTSATILWLLYTLAKNPDIQEKVRKEIMSIFSENDRDVTIEDVHKLRYLDMVIKETLRLYPSPPYISRFLNSDLHLNKYTIPSKTNVGIPLFLIHRNPVYFPDPDRFLPEAVRKRHPFAYIPFSGGVRNCIGKKFAMIEIKIIISTILRKMIIKEHLIQKIKLVPQIVLRPNPRIVLSFTPL